MSTLFFLAALILLVDYCLEFVIARKNLQALSPTVPAEFVSYYDADRYAKSQAYLAERTHLDLVQGAASLGLWVALLLSGALAIWDEAARTLDLGPVLTGLVFFAGLGGITAVVNLPFAIISTFSIEARFGFNRTSWRTFVMDRVKGLFLLVAVGAPIGATALWFFHHLGPSAWLWVWLAMIALQVMLMFLAPALIMPLFYKFEPLPEGELKREILALAARLGFPLEGVYRMDGSKRSTKANAFFTGFGKTRRIVLFDTLIEKQSVPELVAVMAHEIGHFKRRHIWRSFLLGIVSQGVLIWLISRVIFAEAWQHADFPSLHLGAVLATILFQPLSRVVSLAEHALSRRYEFEADAFAREALGSGKELSSALMKLSVDSLSNLTPHPWKVLFDYTHPPVLARIRALNS